MTNLDMALLEANIDVVWFENNLDLIRGDLSACGVDPEYAYVDEWVCSAKFVYDMRDEELTL